MSGFPHIFKTLQIGSVSIPNRLFMSAGNTNFFKGTAPPNDRALAFYEARSIGGVGLIITGQHFPFPPTTASAPTAYQSDQVIPHLKRLAETIHKHGAKCFAQLSHPGVGMPARSAGGGATWGVSSSSYWQYPMNPGRQASGHQIDPDDISYILKAYADGAVRFKKAGYDGVEIRAVMGQFQAQFLSGVMNVRTDEYGGSLENRMRLLLETINSVRKAVGTDFVVGTRFTADEFLEKTWWSEARGNTVETGIRMSKILEQTGQLDYLFPCSGTIYPPHIPSMYYPLGAFAFLAAEIKRNVKLPVFTSGRINDPTLAEELLGGGQADMVGMFRGLVADPELPKKAKSGRAEEIRRCIGCCEGCVGHPSIAIPLSCTVNVQAGREKTFIIQKADKQKKVLIIGGGGAGLETARVAALRGHSVTLYEKEGILGKDLTVAAKGSGRDGWEDVLRYYRREMSRLKVDVHLNSFASLEMVEGLMAKDGYDVLVIATGAIPFIPEVPGMQGAEILVAEAREVLEENREIGENILVVAYENHSVALTLADTLADRGKRVEIITESLFAGAQLDFSTAETLYARLLSKGVVITPLTGLKEIQGKSVVVRNSLTGGESFRQNLDAVVFAVEAKPNDLLYRKLKGKVREIYLVGQSLSPRRLLDSVFDGATAAMAM